MNFKKFISGISALTIAASVFAGMAVTASAAETSLGDITASGDKGITIAKIDADHQFVLDFDVYVAKGASVAFAYYNNGNLGTQFRFTDEDGDGWVAIQYNTGAWNDINTSNPHSIYKADNTIHVTLTTAESASGMGNTEISIAGDDAVFTQEKDGKPVVRKPYRNRAIGARNLSKRTLNKITFTVKNAAEETTATGMSNVTYENQKIAMSGNTAACEATYSDDAGASVWSATITNDTINGLSKATATATLSDGETTASSAETEFTEVAAGSSVVLAVVVNKAQADLSGVTISLK